MPASNNDNPSPMIQRVRATWASQQRRVAGPSLSGSHPRMTMLALRQSRPSMMPVARQPQGHVHVVEFCEIADALKLDASALLSSIFLDRR